MARTQWSIEGIKGGIMRIRLFISLFFIGVYGHMLTGNPYQWGFEEDEEHIIEEYKIKIQGASFKVSLWRIERIEWYWQSLLEASRTLDHNVNEYNITMYENAKKKYEDLIFEAHQLVIEGDLEAVEFLETYMKVLTLHNEHQDIKEVILGRGRQEIK